MALWSGRFTEGADAFTQRFGASLPVDQRLYAEDIAGSIAHANMLAAQGIIATADAEAIAEGLQGILADITSGALTFDVMESEDIHMAIEAELTRRVGDAGARLHTGRSRNDQVATDTRLYAKRRAGELMAREASRRLGVQQGILVLSLAPTPAEGDSVAEILEAIGVGQCGGPGTTAALAMLNDAVKKGGVMASSHVGGLSGAFIPVSEDEGMIAAALDGTLTLDKLEAMTCVCSVGLDMIAVPGSTTAETISAIIADEAAVGMVNSKTTAVRIIPVEGKDVGDMVELGGLLGSAPVMPVHEAASTDFIARGGRIPAPLQSLKN